MVLQLKEHSSHALIKVTRKLEMEKLLYNSINYLIALLMHLHVLRYDIMVLKRVEVISLYTFWKSIPW